MALTVGSRLGHYNVTALIGEGGMGQVYPVPHALLRPHSLVEPYNRHSLGGAMVRSFRRQNVFHLGLGFALVVLATVVMMGSIVRSLWLYPLN